MAAQKEIRSLTGLRGVAALYVVGLHFTQGVSPVAALQTFLEHGYMAVDLFFVLSGFVMALNYQAMFASGWSLAAYLKFLGRRIARVYPLYFVCTLAALLLLLTGFLPGISSFGSLSWTLAKNLAMIQVWGFGRDGSLENAAWSISAEWAAYLVFPALLALMLFRKPLIAWLAGLACVVVLMLLCLLSSSFSHTTYLPRSLDLTGNHGVALIRCIAEFSLGLLSFRVAGTSFGRGLAESRWVATALCVTLLALLTLPGSDLLIALLLPLLMVCTASGKHGVNRILSSGPAEFLGIMSYSIYLTHQFLGPLAYRIQLKASALGIVHAHSYAFLIRWVLILPLAMLANKFIEIPGRRWLRVLFEGDEVKPVCDNPMVPG